MYVGVEQAAVKPGSNRTEKKLTKADKLQLTKAIEKTGRCEELLYRQKVILIFK